MGQAPQQQHVARAINLHGPSIAAEIYAPDSGWSRAAALRAKLDTIQAALHEAIRAIEEMAE